MELPLRRLYNRGKPIIKTIPSKPTTMTQVRWWADSGSLAPPAWAPYDHRFQVKESTG